MKRKAITIGLLALAIAGGARANTLVYCSPMTVANRTINAS